MAASSLKRVRVGLLVLISIVISCAIGLMAGYLIFVVSVNWDVKEGSQQVAMRRTIIERAANLSIPGARSWVDIPDEERYPGKTIIRVGDPERLPFPLSDEIHAQESQSNGFVFHDLILLRLYDWSKVEHLSGGGKELMEALLAQAGLHEQELAKANFALIHCSAWDEGSWQSTLRNTGNSINVSRSETSRWGGTFSSGSGGYSINASSPRIVYWRFYAATDCAACLNVRFEYDQNSKRLLMEFCYTDRSFLGVKYPPGSWTVKEQIK